MDKSLFLPGEAAKKVPPLIARPLRGREGDPLAIKLGGGGIALMSWPLVIVIDIYLGFLKGQFTRYLIFDVWLPTLCSRSVNITRD